MDSENGAVAVLNIINLVVSIISLVAVWKVFKKAGRPGWGAIVPFYNLYLLLKIAGKPGWWLILFLIPFVNIYAAFSMCIGIAKAFNRSTMFGIFMLGFLQFIGFMILGFGKSTYVGDQPLAKPDGTVTEDKGPQAPLISPGEPLIKA